MESIIYKQKPNKELGISKKTTIFRYQVTIKNSTPPDFVSAPNSKIHIPIFHIQNNKIIHDHQYNSEHLVQLA